MLGRIFQLLHQLLDQGGLLAIADRGAFAQQADGLVHQHHGRLARVKQRGGGQQVGRLVHGRLQDAVTGMGAVVVGGELGQRNVQSHQIDQAAADELVGILVLLQHVGQVFDAMVVNIQAAGQLVDQGEGGRPGAGRRIGHHVLGCPDQIFRRDLGVCFECHWFASLLLASTSARVARRHS
ncbi:hypothetical protein D3C84_370880 [compost metagenome]